jgi:hypothetical protein
MIITVHTVLLCVIGVEIPEVMARRSTLLGTFEQHVALY